MVFLGEWVQSITWDVGVRALACLTQPEGCTPTDISDRSRDRNSERNRRREGVQVAKEILLLATSPQRLSIIRISAAEKTLQLISERGGTIQ
jgi:hypothetical protein